MSRSAALVDEIANELATWPAIRTRGVVHRGPYDANTLLEALAR